MSSFVCFRFSIASRLAIEGCPQLLKWGSMHIATSSISKGICSNDIFKTVWKSPKLIAYWLKILCRLQEFAFATSRKFTKCFTNIFIFFNFVGYLQQIYLINPLFLCIDYYLDISHGCKTVIFFTLAKLFAFTRGFTTSLFVSKVTIELTFKRTILISPSFVNSASYEPLTIFIIIF